MSPGNSAHVNKTAYATHRRRPSSFTPSFHQLCKFIVTVASRYSVVGYLLRERETIGTNSPTTIKPRKRTKSESGCVKCGGIREYLHSSHTYTVDSISTTSSSRVSKFNLKYAKNVALIRIHDCGKFKIRRTNIRINLFSYV